MKTLFIGLEKTAEGKALNPELVRLTTVQIKTEAAKLFGGYSASIVSGGWINWEGELVEEKALRLELATDDACNVEGFAAWSGALLSQACVMVSSHASAVTFVNASAPSLDSAA